MVSISTTTVFKIKQVLNTESKPKWIESLILSNLKQGLKYQKLVIQKDFLDLCARKKVCPPEILALAKRVGGHGHNGDNENVRDITEERRFLNI